MLSKTNRNRKYMDLAISMASDRIGLTGSNPSVACVIVKNNKIISTGQTGIGGVPHAEADAINNSSEKVNGSILYVTLEPCSHYAKTPPCTKLIINSKIKKVFYSVNDIDTRSAGKSEEIFKNNKISCQKFLLKKRGLDLYNSYFHIKKSDLPFVTGKIVCTKDYYINTGSKYISNKFSLDFSHLLRYKNHGLLISYKTANSDNPKLSCRLPGLEKFSPHRIIIDKDLKIKKNLYLIKSAKKVKTFIFYNKKNPKYKYLKKKGIKMIYCSVNSNKELDLFDLLKKIKKLKIDYLLVEGGKKLTLSFLKLNLFNNFYLIRSDQYSFGKKKNNIHEISKFLKKRNLLKTKIVKTYLEDDKITQYYK